MLNLKLNIWVKIVYRLKKVRDIMGEIDYKLLFLGILFFIILITFGILGNYNLKKLNKILDTKDKELSSLKDKLLESEALYKSILSASPDAVTVIDANGKIVMASASAKKIFGVENEAIVGRNVMDFIATEHHESLIFNIKKLLMGENTGANEYEAVHSEGHKFVVEINSEVVLGNASDGRKILSVIRDITDRRLSDELIKNKEAKYRMLVKELEEKNNILNKIATNDKLTGIKNRYYFDKRVIEEISVSDRYSTPLSMLVFDLDNFKDVNDSFGHDVGDRVLINIADKITRLMRKSDTFARWGGEEFVILMTHTNLEGAIIAAEKIRREAESLYHIGVGKVTISIGVAERHKDETLDLWFKRADRALYRAKKEGRNRVCSDTEEANQIFVDIKWQESWNSGHKEIDFQHQKLLNIVNSIIEIIFKEKDEKSLEIKLLELLDHIEYHFEYEESVLREMGYENSDQHRKIHKKLLTKADELIDKYRRHEDSMKFSDIFEFIVGDVIVEHLVKEDSKFFECFK